MTENPENRAGMCATPREGAREMPQEPLKEAAGEGQREISLRDEPVASKETMQKLDIDFVVQRLVTHSPYGEDLRRHLPVHSLRERALIERKLDILAAGIAFMKKNATRIGKIDAIMCEFNQLRGTAKRLREGVRLSMIELHELKTFAINVGRLGDALAEMYWKDEIGEFELPDLAPVVRILDPNDEGTGTFHIYSAYSKLLGTIRSRIEVLQRRFAGVAQPMLKALEEEGYTISQGVVRIRKNDAKGIARAEADSRLAFRSESPTMRSYFVSDAKEIEDELEKLRVQEADEEQEVRGILSERLAVFVPQLECAFDAIGEIDLLIAKSRFSIAFSLTRPKISSRTKLAGAFHLKVKTNLEKSGGRFSPIDIELKTKTSVITGANMGGKTVSIKLIGQVVLLAQMGFYVPCESAEVELFDKVFISVGDDQNIDLGLSTFGSEMIKLISVLGAEYEFALVLMDELARGTNPSEGAALSVALVEHLEKLPVRSVITTHFDGLTLVPGVTHYQVIGLENADLSSIQGVDHPGALRLHEFMDYRLREVHAHKEIPKEAIRISEILGLEKSIVDRAREILENK